MAYEMYCKYCSSKLLKYEKWERKYKSPISICKNVEKNIWIQDVMNLRLKAFPRKSLRFQEI